MPKRKTYRILLSLHDRIDVDLEFEKRSGRAPRIRRFAVTYSAWIEEGWREVVRYDNFHGYLHRQRFWRSGEPERIRGHERPLSDAVLDACREDLRRNWKRYRALMEARIREE